MPNDLSQEALWAIARRLEDETKRVVLSISYVDDKDTPGVSVRLGGSLALRSRYPETIDGLKVEYRTKQKTRAGSVRGKEP